jgi:hypothetical protein
VACRLFDCDRMLVIFFDGFSGTTLPSSASVAPERRKSASCRFSWSPNALHHVPEIVAQGVFRIGARDGLTKIGTAPMGSAGRLAR